MQNFIFETGGNKSFSNYNSLRRILAGHRGLNRYFSCNIHFTFTKFHGLGAKKYPMTEFFGAGSRSFLFLAFLSLVFLSTDNVAIIGSAFSSIGCAKWSEHTNVSFVICEMECKSVLPQAWIHFLARSVFCFCTFLSNFVISSFTTPGFANGIKYVPLATFYLDNDYPTYTNHSCNAWQPLWVKTKIFLVQAYLRQIATRKQLSKQTSRNNFLLLSHIVYQTNRNTLVNMNV